MVPAIGVFIGFAILCVSIGFVYYAFTIRRDYPDLNDPSRNVDAYWPSVVYAIANFIAGIAAFFGLPVFGYSIWRFTKRRSVSKPPSA